MSGRPRVQGHAHVPDTESESRLTYSHGKSINMAGLSARTTGASSGRAATSHISKPSGACPASGKESALAHACHARIIQAETVKPSGKHWRTTDMPHDESAVTTPPDGQATQERYVRHSPA